MTTNPDAREADALSGVQLAADLAATIIEASSGWVLLLDGELTVLAASAAFCRVFDLDVSRVALVGYWQLGVAALQGAELRLALEATLRGAPSASVAIVVEQPDEATRRLVAHVARLACPGLPHALLLVSLEDVTDREAASSERDHARQSETLLLQEARHRISNGLQIIAGILLQTARATVAAEARGHLLAASSRVMAVAALERHLSDGSDEAVDLRTYLTDLCAHITEASVSDPTRVSLRQVIDVVTVDAATAASLGMIVTELVANSLKHAFPGDRDGRVTISFHAEAANWVLTVADNGVGMPAAIPRAGLGTDIVAALARQLRATVAVTNGFPGKITVVTHEEAVQLAH